MPKFTEPGYIRSYAGVVEGSYMHVHHWPDMFDASAREVGRIDNERQVLQQPEKETKSEYASHVP